MIRHPKNRNLHLHYEKNYMGLPVIDGKGPLVTEYLSQLKSTIDKALDEYPRVLAFRVDLRFPEDYPILDTNAGNTVISRFIESFKSKIRHNRSRARAQSQRVHDSQVRYVWAREGGKFGYQHYHLLILLNRDAFFTVGRLGSPNDNLIRRVQEAWASALGVPVWQAESAVHLPENAEYRIDRCPRKGDKLPDLFYRASYLCKRATKLYGNGRWGFGASRG